jgi:hypothetical protein
MNPEEYKAWRERIRKIMEMDEEQEDFIVFVLSWIDHMKGKSEAKLISEYHPGFKGLDDDNRLIWDFMEKARLVPQEFEDKYFKLQIFDSAFFLYRPLLKLKFMKGDLDS